jgi:hypothetical protein
MINIENANIEFDKYASNFNQNEGRIKLKIEHIKRVAQMSKKIAIHLQLTEEQIMLAELIGLFHDIGRFKQAEIYNTFNDRISINHAELSVKVLFEDNIIDRFNVEEKDKKIIKTAILNHNKAKIEEGLDGEELLFSQIIRDADKMDIFYTICEYDFESIFWYQGFDSAEISNVLMKEFSEDHFLNYSNIKTNADQIPIFYAYIFDFNFNFSLEFLKEKKYLDKFTDRVIEKFESDTVKEQTKKLLEMSNKFITAQCQN